MKYHLATTLLSLICWNRWSRATAWVEQYDLCDSKVTDNLHILNIFNLRDDMIIQTLNYKSNAINYWSVRNAKHPDVSAPDDIPDKVNASLFDSPSQDYLNSVFRNNIGDPFGGHTLQISEEVIVDCANFSRPTEDGCKALSVILEAIYGEIVCIRNYKTREMDVFEYFSIADGRAYVFELENSMRQRLKQECDSTLHNVSDRNQDVLSLTLWPVTFARDSYVKLLQLAQGNTLWLQVFQDKELEYFKDRLELDRTKVELIFKYNNYMTVLGCPRPCKWQLPLYYIPFSDNGFENEFIQVSFTLKDMIGCKHERKQEFNPNKFCDLPNNFRSIFSLGDNLYFQRSGRFWRYTHYGFKKDANPSLPFEMMPIRYDSDFTSFLINQSFDTNSNIYGFGFKIIYNEDMCATNDKSCRDKYENSRHYFRVCLYGHKVDTFGGKSLHMNAYQYTPNGLQKFNKESVLSETKEFCSKVFEEMGTESLGENSAVSVYSLMAPAYIGFVSRDNKFCLIRVEWKAWRPIKVSFEPMLCDERQFESLFIMFDNMYSVDRHQNVFRVSHKDYTDNPLEVKNIGKLDKFLKCPFNSTFSLVDLKKRRKICAQKETEIESVFTIGSHRYHQLGQHFYKLVETDFVYDKYVTNLFNDYFDTRHRVTGYSILVPNTRSDKLYEVVIHGKSSHSYRSLGQYIYALFTVDETFIPILEAMRHQIDSQYPEPDITIGISCPAIKNQFILAFDFIYTPEKRIVWLTYESGGYLELYSSWNSSKFMFPFDRDCDFGHNVSSLMVPMVYGSEDKIPIIGIGYYGHVIPVHSLLPGHPSIKYQGNFYVLVRHGQTVIVNNIGGHVFDVDQQFPPLHYQTDNDWSQLCPDPRESHFSETTISYILMLLILVLIIIIIIVGLLTHFKNLYNESLKTTTSDVNTSDNNSRTKDKQKPETDEQHIDNDLSVRSD